MKYLLLIFCFTNVLAQDKKQDFLSNECWEIKGDISGGAVIFGAVYNFYENGKFEATTYYSGDMYFTETVGGIYTYNPMLNEVVLVYKGLKAKRTKPIKKAMISLRQSKNKYILSIKNEYLKGGQGFNNKFDDVIDFDIKTIITDGYSLAQSEKIKGDLTHKKVTFSRTKIKQQNKPH
ncbi:hypothetical protein EZJ43_07825 [Pedobacter changchengzhani]|uniref:Uncharacterized protein n=1 Tax=Pedobacter changchengzhani TaxID=2529274 RepID=A0A4R5MLB2_9SPHI|nr:hypothetical protein [Pedobacter changchengzhani]TDG36418.1 hypothetical protein EZJ43_07825 [Pedobacter changchengzhani]